MASSSKGKTNPHQTGGSITDFFTNLRATSRSDVRSRTYGVKPHKLKRLRNTGGVDKPRKQNTVVNTDRPTAPSPEDTTDKPFTVDYEDVIYIDAKPPARSEEKNPWECHLPSSTETLPNLSSHAVPRDRKCIGSIYLEKASSVKRVSHLPQTLAHPVHLETSDEGPCNHWQDKKSQHHLLLKSGVKSTYKSCDQDLLMPHQEQFGKTQTSRRIHQSEKAEKPDTQASDVLPAHSAIQPGGHVLQKPHGHLLWGLPWPTSPLLRNLSQSFPLWSSDVQHPPQWNSLTTESVPSVERQRRTGWRRDLSEDILKQLLEEIKVTNPSFPVQRFFTILSKKRSECEKTLADQVSEGCTHSPDVHCLRGKRKWRLEGLNAGLSPKRQRPNPRSEEKAVAGPSFPTGSSLAVTCHTPRRRVCQSRLSRTRRRRQQQDKPSTVTLNLWDTKEKNSENTPQFPGQEIQWEDVLWTEKYKPQRSTDVVGNPAGVKKLHTWLKEWKLRADKEECRRRKEEMQREKSKGPWDSGDFEGEVVFDDCELELGTALLITGPHGVGKTAAVYACAQELGFKVFEVNASSQRSGRLLLAQLKEATQSHQVGTPTASSLKPTYFTSHSTAGCSAKPTSSLQKVKVMKSTLRQPTTLRKTSLRRACSTSVNLTRFFQKINKPETKNHSSPHRIQHDVHKMEPNSDKSEAQGPATVIIDDEDNHSMTSAGKSTLMSLILFEEVDVIFSEDVGFLSSIKTFMSTTKRPVVLTTTDPWFGGTFDGHLEELHFKKPPVRVVCSYLQLVCLVENVRTDPQDISSLPAAQTGDIRHCLLQLQFWVRSGGGAAAPLPLNHPVMPPCPPCGKASSRAPKETVKRPKQPADLPPCETGCSGTPQEFVGVHEVAKMFKVSTLSTSENRGCLETLSESQQTKADLLHLNLEAPIPQPTTTSPNPSLKVVSDSGLKGNIQATKLPEPPVVDTPPGGSLSSKPRKRRCLSLKGLQRSKPNSPDKSLITSHHSIEGHCHHMDQPEGRTKIHSGEKKTSSLVSSCLHTLTELLDNLSFLDCCLQDRHVTGHSIPDLLFVRTQVKFRDGMLDELREDEPTRRHTTPEIRAAVEGMSFRRCLVEMEQVMARLQRQGEEVEADQCKQMLEQLTFPPPPHTRGLLSSQPSYIETKD